MIRNLSIRNFKSVKKLDIPFCKRVNVFIGEYNSGKSNILEALSFLSTNSFVQENFNELFRFKNITDLFYDCDAGNNIEIRTDRLNFHLFYAKNRHGALLNHFNAITYPAKAGLINNSNLNGADTLKSSMHDVVSCTIDFNGKLSSVETKGNVPIDFRTYLFKRLKAFKPNYYPMLNPPFGDNLPTLLVSNSKFKELVSSIIREKDLRLILKPSDNDIEVAKDVNDILYSYPYNSVSETLQRIIFYTLAIESNKDATLIFDEPDSNTFPMYTKQMAELIAADKSNQYFIATHNPYLLGSLISKTPKENISVFVTSMKQYETVINEVPQEKLSELLDTGADIFFNLDKFTE